MAAPTWGSREQVLGRRLSWAIKTAVLPRALLLLFITWETEGEMWEKQKRRPG